MQLAAFGLELGKVSWLGPISNSNEPEGARRSPHGAPTEPGLILMDAAWLGSSSAQALAARPGMRMRFGGYTDAKVQLMGAEAQSRAYMDRDDAAAYDDSAERRIDASDGCAYTRDEFIAYYKE